MNGEFEGEGIFYFFDGTKYEGQFKVGKREGKGVRTYEDGTKYVGDWADNNKNG